MSSDVRNSVGDSFAADQFPPGESNALDLILPQSAGKILDELPNDLARLIYLASIRDYNTGVYLQAELCRQHSVAEVDRVLRLHHERIFDHLVETPVSAYVDQLRLYISFAGAPRAELIRTWKDLKPYNSAIPLACDRLAAELFGGNVMAALCILEQAG
jgi:hypothetical protein